MAAVDLHLPAFVREGEDVLGFDQRTLGGLTPNPMVGSDSLEVDWASTAQHKIDLANMEATGIKLTPPIEAPTADADPDPSGLSVEPEEDPDDEIDFYAMLNLDDTTEDPFAMAPGGSSGQLFPVNLLAETGDMEMPVYPVIPNPDDMDVDDLYSFFAPSPARNMGDGEGSSNISVTGHDTEMTDDDTAAEGKLIGETLRRVRDQSIQPEIAEPEVSSERPIYSPLVEESGVDRNSLEPDRTAVNANLGQDELREMHNGGDSDIFADDGDSDVSSPPDSEVEDPGEPLVPAGASESTNTKDWTIRFAGDLRRWQPPRSSRRTGSTSAITGSKTFKTVLPSHKGHRSKSRRDREISTMTAEDVTTADVDRSQAGSTGVPGCMSCSDYFARGFRLKKDEAVSCCQQSSEYTNLLSGIMDGTKTVPWSSEGKYNCGTENERCRTCKTRRVKCWISRGTVDASSTGLRATEDSG